MSGILSSVSNEINEGEVTFEKPYIFDGDWLQDLLYEFNYDFAARLRDCTRTSDKNSSSVGDNGFLLTFHRDGIPLSENDNVVAVDLPDEAGVTYPSPDITNILKGPHLPLPADVIKYVQIRVATTRLGVPQKSDYDLFKKLEAENALGFGHPELGMIKPDAMVVATCQDGKWTPNMAIPYSNLGLSPNMQALHYGSAEFEGMTCEIGEDGNVYVFGMKEHYTRYRNGAIKQGIEYVTYEMFVDGITKAIQQNARFIPAYGKGRLYIRQHAADIGPQMRVGNSRVSGFFVEVTPIGAVGAYFGKTESVETGKNVPMKVLGVPDNKLRSSEGQGLVKGIGNYSHTPPVIKAVKSMNLAKDGEKDLYPDGVLYLNKMVEGMDPASEEYRNVRVCETNASNTLFIKNLPDGRYAIIAPTLAHGDILPGNTRMLILAKAREMGWDVDDESDVTLGELIDHKFDAAINCGTAAMISPVDAIHFLHVEERNIEDDADPSVPKMVAQPRGTFIQIRDQEAVNADPTPKAAAILLQKLLAVKQGASGDADKERYLTQVPGLRAR